jgi:hypothetical protein
MILRPPKNFNEYSVSVPMSIDWILKTLWKLKDNYNTGTNTSNTLIDGGSFTSPNNYVLIDGGSFV